MSTITLTRGGTTVVAPRVNLLPPEIAEAAKFRKLQVLLGAAVLGTLGVVILLTIIAAGQVASAQKTLDDTQAVNVGLQRQVSQLAAVPTTYAAVATAQTQLSTAMGSEVRWSFYLNDLSLTIPDNVSLDTLTVKQDAAGSSTSTGAVTSATGTPGIGTVTFVGQAGSNNDLATFLDSLAKQKGYVDPYFSQAIKATDATSGRTTVQYTANVTVTDKAESGRYTPKGS